MIVVNCACGAPLSFPEADLGADAACGRCAAVARFVAGEPLAEGAGLGDFDTHLTVRAGPAGVGQRLYLGGIADISIGKLEDRHVILPGTKVSRRHAILKRLEFGPSRWEIRDENSTNGLFVNGQRATAQELRPGDAVRIGEYEMLFGTEPQQPAADPRPRTPPSQKTLGPNTCLSCGKAWPPATQICTNCGVYVATGRPVVVSKGIDLNQLAINAETFIPIASIFVPLGIFPIASEALGNKKPLATWIITAITVVVSAWFLIQTHSREGYESTRHLMLWCGSIQNLGLHNLDAASQQALDEVVPRFHWYQLFTSALLHGGILHLGGNLVFLLVFGLRVNELIGNLKFAVVYPLLAAASGYAEYYVLRNAGPTPLLGASGAIMGVAGMYFVFFPVQKVHVAIWIRLFLFRIFGYKVFQMRGVWLLAIWVALNDALPVVLGAHDHVAHWAHLGGFLAGAALALLMLVTRTVHSNGGDILSVTLGRRAWSLVGKPGSRLAPA